VEYNSSQPPSTAGRILLVDDDERFLSTVEAILAAQFESTTCVDPSAALRLDFDEFHVVCADFRMPQMSGLELLHHVSRRSSTTCCLLMTGADDFYDSIKQTERRPPVIFKPLDPQRFINTIAHLVSICQMKRATQAMVGAAGAPSSRPPRSNRTPSEPAEPPSSTQFGRTSTGRRVR
jgi:DNA-binding NtrC family response regulator